MSAEYAKNFANIKHADLLIASFEAKKKGIKKEYNANAEKFANLMQQESFEERLAFLTTADDYLGDAQLNYLIIKNIVWPTLIEWIKFKPTDQEPYLFLSRWFYPHYSYISFSEEMPRELRFDPYEKLLELDPKNISYQQAFLEREINRELDAIGFAFHHIYEDVLLDKEEYLQELCVNLEEKIARLQDAKFRKKCEEEQKMYAQLIADWIEYKKTQQEISFLEFSYNKGRRYPVDTIFHFE